MYQYMYLSILEKPVRHTHTHTHVEQTHKCGSQVRAQGEQMLLEHVEQMRFYRHRGRTEQCEQPTPVHGQVEHHSLRTDRMEDGIVALQRFRVYPGRQSRVEALCQTFPDQKPAWNILCFGIVLNYLHGRG